jgi:hypothetical protein
MLRLSFGNTAENIVVTLNEKRTLDSGYYLFLFTHYTTKQVVSKIFSFAEDDSDYPDRYNQFEINTDTLFDNYPVGMWSYSVYEQASSSNTNPAGLNEVENGILMLRPETEFSFDQYEQSQSYKVYAG